MIKSKAINANANIVDKKARELSSEMSKNEYKITESMVNPGLQKMKRVIRMMGFKNTETDAIIDSVRKDLVGKEMKKGDSFHELMKDSFTKAITNILEKIKK